MSDNKNRYKHPLDGYSSELKEIIIPLHNFKHYHNSDSAENLDDSYIGRETIIGKLKNWITDENTLVGTYLVTGYRGMGKSSFVNRVLKEIQSSRKFINKLWFTLIKLSLIALTLLLCARNSLVRDENTVTIFFVCISSGAIILFGAWIIKLLLRIGEDRASKTESINNGKLRTEYLQVRINIGKEIITRADDIMRLIVKNVYDNFKNYVYNCPNKHLFYSYLKLCTSLTITFIVISYTKFESLSGNYENLSAILAEIYNGLISVYVSYNQICTFGLSAIVLLLAYHLTNYIFYVIGKIKLLGFPTYESILSDLSKLYERSVASVEEGENTSFNQFSFFSSFRRYEKATLREMEQELIQIFSDISDKKYFSRWRWVNVIRFVIVLDELDKVDVAVDDNTTSDDLPYYDVSASGFAGSQNARKRKQQLMKTLANMKYFLSTVKAKFIFVGGRELFDAYLGDVSDREYSISSVFDGVLNINSFFTSGVQGSDVTAMTEEFVCSKLCPPENKVTNLSGYYAYLTGLESNPVAEMNEQTKNRVISFLYQYILYLVHISNGSPKKISVFFEKNIRSKEHIENIMKVEVPRYSKNEAQYYLCFGTKDIYKVGFMHYISYPLIQTMSGKANRFDDKLLVSTSFIINHIYKYHNTGFSWRNLEHIPELLDMNKNPELRDFLGSIVSLLNQTHLASIQSGLYLFKFPMRISEEISFISKQIEDISALFHFSKDESQPVKKHYIHQLDYYTHNRNEVKDADLYTLASLHHILADIYQADEDYSQAISEYQTGLQLVASQLDGKNYDDDPHWISKMLFIIRNMLKMGVAFEKRKTYDSAYTTYSELNKHLADYREMQEEELNLDYYLYKKEPSKLGWNAMLYKHSNDALTFSFEPQRKKENYMLHNQDEGEGYGFASEQITYEFTRFLTPKKLAVLMRQSIFSDIRMAYLPTLAKLFVLEKMDTEGITSSNLELAESEFFYLHLFVNDELRPLIYSDFFQKMGDILYYKNGLPGQPIDNILYALALNGCDIREVKDRMHRLLESDNSVTAKNSEDSVPECGANTIYRNSGEIDEIFRVKEIPERIDKDTIVKIIKNNTSNLNDEKVNGLFENIESLDDPRILECMRQRQKMAECGRRIPCHACKYYNMSFSSILKHILGINEDQNISRSVSVMTYLQNHRKRLSGMPQNSLLMVANTLKGLANAKLSCSDNTCILSAAFLSDFFQAFENFYELEFCDEVQGEVVDMSRFCEGGLNNLNKAMLLYVEAGMFFDMAGRSNDASQMYRQILEILNLYLRTHTLELKYREDYLEIIAANLKRIEALVNRTIRMLYSNYEGINMLEIAILKDLFGRNANSDISLHHLPMTPDIEELIYRYYALYLRCDRTEMFGEIYNAGMMSSSRQLCTFSQNIQNMRFKFLMNAKIFEQLTGIKRPDSFQEETAIDEVIVSKISDYLDKTPSQIYAVLHSWGITDNGTELRCDTKAEKLEILTFFIVDSLACLSDIKNILHQLNNPTSYISYFLGDVCLYIAFWRKLYDEFAVLYDAADEYSNKYDLPQDYAAAIKDSNIQDKYKSLYTALIADNVKEQFVAYANMRINRQDMERLSLRYNVEQSLQYYKNAKEMHIEGRNYRKNILTLYFLDDDLNNDSIQQNLALERYLINTDNIDHRERMLYGILKNSRLFRSESYLN